MKLDDAAKAKIMHSTVHENMLKRLNEEPPTVASEAEEIGYDTQSEEQD